MLKIEYYSSTDPLLGLIRNSASDVFDRPYLGYIFFLFGTVDCYVENWLRNNLLNIDSLTGNEIAGIVLAKKFPAQIKAHNREHLGIENNPVKYNDEINVDHIRYNKKYNTQSMIRDGAIVRDVNVVATTYATDEFAKTLGVVDQLPCIIVTDGAPESGIEVFAIKESNLENIMQIFRTMVGDFTSNGNNEIALSELKNLKLLNDEHYSLKSQCDDHHHNFKCKIAKLENNPCWDIDIAFEKMLHGSVRKLEFYLKKIDCIDNNIKNITIDRCTKYADDLRNLSKTIYTLDWYIERSKAGVCNEDQKKLAHIYEKHINIYIDSEHTKPSFFTEGNLHLLQDILTAKREHISSIVWGKIDKPEIFTSKLEKDLISLKERHFEKIEEIEEKILKNDEKIYDCIKLIENNRSSLQDSFKYALGALKWRSARRSLSHQAANLFSGFLRPHARDIYIGTNVGAMGPDARAYNTTIPLQNHDVGGK